jgi:hypothetical protein
MGHKTLLNSFCTKQSQIFESDYFKGLVVKFRYNKELALMNLNLLSTFFAILGNVELPSIIIKFNLKILLLIFTFCNHDNKSRVSVWQFKYIL